MNWVFSLFHCVVLHVLKSHTTIYYGNNLEFLISHEIFHVLDFLRMETCTVLYYTHGYYCNPKYIYFKIVNYYVTKPK